MAHEKPTDLGTKAQSEGTAGPSPGPWIPESYNGSRIKAFFPIPFMSLALLAERKSLKRWIPRDQCSNNVCLNLLTASRRGCSNSHCSQTGRHLAPHLAPEQKRLGEDAAHLVMVRATASSPLLDWGPPHAGLGCWMVLIWPWWYLSQLVKVCTRASS